MFVTIFLHLSSLRFVFKCNISFKCDFKVNYRMPALLILIPHNKVLYCKKHCLEIKHLLNTANMKFEIDWRHSWPRHAGLNVLKSFLTTSLRLNVTRDTVWVRTWNTTDNILHKGNASCLRANHPTVNSVPLRFYTE